MSKVDIDVELDRLADTRRQLTVKLDRVLTALALTLDAECLLRQRTSFSAKVVPITGRRAEPDPLSSDAQRCRDAVQFLRTELAELGLSEAQHGHPSPGR